MRHLRFVAVAALLSLFAAPVIAATLVGNTPAATDVRRPWVRITASTNIVPSIILVNPETGAPYAPGTTATPAGDNNIGNVDVLTLPASGYSASATFTPAAASHTAGDANGAAGTFALAAPSGKEVIITSASLEIDGATAEATAWRLYLYNVTPPSALADDAAWDLPSGDRASFLGYVDLGTAVDLGSTQWVQVHILNQQVKLAGTSLFSYLVNMTTVTPAAVAHTVTLHAIAPRRRRLPPRTSGGRMLRPRYRATALRLAA